MDAIRKLPPLQNKKRRKQDIVLIVIRIDKNGNLKNSQPCVKCLEHINKPNYSSWYRLTNIWYSNQEGNIIHRKLQQIIDSEKKHITRRFKT